MSIKLSSNTSLAIKICGLTIPSQAKYIATLGINAIGVIGVKSSSRYVSEKKRSEIFNEVISISSNIERVLVTADISEKELSQSINCCSPPSVIQLHGNE